MAQSVVSSFSHVVLFFSFSCVLSCLLCVCLGVALHFALLCDGIIKHTWSQSALQTTAYVNPSSVAMDHQIVPASSAVTPPVDYHTNTGLNKCTLLYSLPTHSYPYPYLQ